MTWAKLDDNFPMHPKLAAIGDLMPLAGWLHVCGLCYCSRYLTDGIIPRKAALSLCDFQHLSVETGGVGGIASFGHDIEVAELIDALVAAGVWHEAGRGLYEIHDYLDYNPSREQVEAERAKTKQRQSRFRNGVSNGGRNGVSNTTPVPVPVPEALTQTPSKDKPFVGKKPVDDVPESVIGYWTGKAGREAKQSDLTSLASIVKECGAERTAYAIGQACAQGEAPDSYGLIRTIARKAVAS